MIIPFSIAIYEETKGDFSNGILFFIQDYLNIYVLLMLAILFGLTSWFGGEAGKEIIINKRHFLGIAIKYAVTIVLMMIVYGGVVGMIRDVTPEYRDFYKRLTYFLLTPLLKTGSILIVPMLLIWLWATNRMRLKLTQIKRDG